MRRILSLLLSAALLLLPACGPGEGAGPSQPEEPADPSQPDQPESKEKND